jgi:outer membrane lipoprotein-sorting protein
MVQDPDAELYLNKLADIFDGNNALQMEFKYEIVSKIENSKVSDFGSIILKGEKYKMRTEDTEIYYNGTKLWSYLANGGEVYASEPDADNLDQSLTNPFRLIGNYKNYYKYRLKDEKSLNGRKYAVIELYPKEQEAEYSILRILIDKSDMMPYSFTMQQKNGYDINITINEIIRNLNIGDSAFEWDIASHPDVTIIEM